MPILSRKQQAEIRKIVDRAGWPGVRAERHDLWRLILKQRQESRLYVNGVVDR